MADERVYMKSIVKSITMLLLALSLVACSSSGSGQETSDSAVKTPEPTETPKEPELKEIEITADNWEDYFVITYTPKPSGEYDYLRGVEMAITLKDEYKDKLSESDSSVLTITYSFNQGLYYSSLNGSEYTVNEKIDKATFDVSTHKGWNYEMFNAFMSYLEPVSDSVTISNDDMLQGKMLFFLGFWRDYGDPFDKTQPNGLVVKTSEFDPADESVWGVVWPEDFIVSDAKGKLFVLD